MKSLLTSARLYKTAVLLFITALLIFSFLWAPSIVNANHDDVSGPWTFWQGMVEKVVSLFSGESNTAAVANYSSVTLSWNNLGSGYKYSLGVKKNDGTWSAPCINAGVIQSNTKVIYKGVCTSDKNRSVPRTDIDLFRLCYTNTTWSNAKCTLIKNDIAEKEQKFDIGGATVTTAYLFWDDLGKGYQYSLDVKDTNGKWYAPCIDAGEISGRTSVTYKGVCTSGRNKNVARKDIATFRLCYTDTTWGNATCKSVKNDMNKQSLRIALTEISPTPEPTPEPEPATSVKLSWNDLGADYKYSFDVQTMDESWIGPCIGAGVIGNSTSVTYKGTCTSAKNKQVSRADVRMFRLCYTNSTWGDALCQSIKNDMTKNSLTLNLSTRPEPTPEPEPEPEPIPSGPVDLSWNSLGSDYQYSLDMKTNSGKWYAPCINAGVIGNKTSITYNGTCTSANKQAVDRAEIDEWRLCYTNSTWSQAKCTSLKNDLAVDGQIFNLGDVPLSAAYLSWADLGEDYQYSLDVKDTNGKWYAPCIDAGEISGRTSVTYKGVCTSGRNKNVARKDIATFRLCYTDTTWGNATCTNVANDMSKQNLQFSFDTYTNPILSTKCADPATYYDQDTKTYYMSCTSPQFGIRKSKDLVNWSWVGKMLSSTEEPSWSRYDLKFRNWAPDLTKIGNKYVAYLTVTGADSSSPAIAVYTANKMTGPWTDALGKPLVSDAHENSCGGVIDPSYFKDPATGKHYLLLKTDGNACNVPTYIMIRELSADGTRFAANSKFTTLLTGGDTWHTLYEGQDMVKYGDYYYIFFAEGAFLENYRMRVARSKNIMGPYTIKSSPILSARPNSALGIIAPGHGTVEEVGDDLYFVYGSVHGKDKLRLPMLDKIRWVDGWPVINDGYPSETPKLIP